MQPFSLTIASDGSHPIVHVIYDDVDILCCGCPRCNDECVYPIAAIIDPNPWNQEYSECWFQVCQLPGKASWIIRQNTIQAWSDSTRSRKHYIPSKYW